MSSPRRRTIHTVSHTRHVRELAATLCPEIDLGISYLRAELEDSGWPSRTPEGDRKPHTGPDETNPDSIDYHDPTGELACRLDRLHDDREAFEDHRHLVENSLRAMHVIALRHMPPSVPAVPACSNTSCHEPVESRVLAGGGLSFVGMEQVAGQWVPKPGAHPVCSRCREMAEPKCGEVVDGAVCGRDREKYKRPDGSRATLPLCARCRKAKQRDGRIVA